jgi:hypothetical protein
MDIENLKPYKTVFSVAFISTIIMLVIIPLQIIVFVVTKIPNSIPEWYYLYNNNLVIGLFHTDLFILVDNILISIIYLALYHSLKNTNKGLLQIGIMLGLIGIAAYISSNKTFEMLRLSQEYVRATDNNMRLLLETTGKSVLAGWQGTAFDTYYVLNGIALLIISILMFRSKIYNKTTAIWGLVSGILMMVPSTAGIIGLVFSILSLIPWYIFSIRFAIVFKTIRRSI